MQTKKQPKEFCAAIKAKKLIVRSYKIAENIQLIEEKRRRKDWNKGGLSSGVSCDTQTRRKAETKQE